MSGALKGVYGRVPHLPGSRLGAGDCAGPPLRLRPDDQVWIQEKLDGSNVAVWRDGDQLRALLRSGLHAASARRPMHRLFAAWAEARQATFLAVLRPGERLVGEWLLLRHGTAYALPHGPFVAFDLMEGPRRLSWPALQARLEGRLPTPGLLHQGWAEPEVVMAQAGQGQHGALDLPEGLIYRVERAGQVVAVSKWVRAGYQAGRYFVHDEAVTPNALPGADHAELLRLGRVLGWIDWA